MGGTHVHPELGGLGDDLGIEAGHPRHVTEAGVDSVAHDGGNVLERQASQQARKQAVTLFGQGQLLIQIDRVIVGQQVPGFQLDQRGRNEQELTRDVDVELTHHIEVAEVLSDDLNEAELGDLELVARDQLQQQIEGALEDACLDFVTHAAGAMVSGSRGVAGSLVLRRSRVSGRRSQVTGPRRRVSGLGLGPSDVVGGDQGVPDVRVDAFWSGAGVMPGEDDGERRSSSGCECIGPDRTVIPIAAPVRRHGDPQSIEHRGQGPGNRPDRRNGLADVVQECRTECGVVGRERRPDPPGDIERMPLVRR